MAYLNVEELTRMHQDHVLKEEEKLTKAKQFRINQLEKLIKNKEEGCLKYYKESFIENGKFVPSHFYCGGYLKAYNKKVHLNDMHNLSKQYPCVDFKVKHCHDYPDSLDYHHGDKCVYDSNNCDFLNCYDFEIKPEHFQKQ
jgi:hypothetical protein